MIVGRERFDRIQRALRRFSIVILTGPRPCGKTSKARQLVNADSIYYFDLQCPVRLARLEVPMTALRSLEGLVLIDEIQRRPERFAALRVLADRTDAPRLTRSIRTAIEDLGLEKVAVIYPGVKDDPIADRVEAVPLAQLAAPEGLSAYLPP